MKTQSKQRNRTRGLTLGRLKAFIRERNASQFISNLQFQIDADVSGFDVTELGNAKKDDDSGCYVWVTEFGTLKEDPRLGCGKLALYSKEGEFIYGDTRVGA